MLGGKTRKQNHCNLTIKIKLLKLEKRRNIKVQSAIDKIEAATHLKTTAIRKSKTTWEIYNTTTSYRFTQDGGEEEGRGIGEQEKEGRTPLIISPPIHQLSLLSCLPHTGTSSSSQYLLRSHKHDPMPLVSRQYWCWYSHSHHFQVLVLRVLKFMVPAKPHMTNGWGKWESLFKIC